MSFWRCRRTSPQADLDVQRGRMPSAIRRLAVRSGGAGRRLQVAPRCGRSVGRGVAPEHPCRARGFAELLSGPGGRGVRRYIDMQDAPPVVGQDDEDEEDPAYGWFAF
jgi:hypothetical protein